MYHQKVDDAVFGLRQASNELRAAARDLPDARSMLISAADLISRISYALDNPHNYIVVQNLAAKFDVINDRFMPSTAVRLLVTIDDDGCLNQ